MSDLSNKTQDDSILNPRPVLTSSYSTMRPLSATECISPAIARTKLVLFTPFRKGRTWKLSATAYLCRIGTVFFPFPLIYLFFLPAAGKAGGALAVVALCIGVLLLTAIAAFIFYLCSRLQFAYFDIVVNRGEFVAPAWRKYGPQSLPWTGIKILIGTAATLACAVPIGAYVNHLIPMFQQMGSLAPGQPPPPEFMHAIFAFYAGYGIILLVFGSVFLLSSLLSDFIVPSLALENTGLAEASRRMVELIRREPGEFTLYVILKVFLGGGIYFAAIIAWEIAFFLCTLIFGLVVVLLGFLLHLAGVSSVILTILAVPVAIAWYIFLMYSMVFPVGAALTYFDAYALYFLGGRYPMLGDLFDRSTPPPTYAYAAAYSQSHYPPPPVPPTPPDREPNV
jgi:hypothetical protein